jgi:hypothetical protein
MDRASSHTAFAGRPVSRNWKKGSLSTAFAGVISVGMTLGRVAVALGGPGVDFDVARAVECRDITPEERLTLYPMQRLVEVSLPISVRFQDASADDVDEVDVEVSGAMAGLRVQSFAPQTQLASEITHEIETTMTSKKSHSLDGTLGGSIPIPGAADAVARITPSITAGIAGCDTATERINRLPVKHVYVVSGTYAEGSGVFFKLKRTSQTSLEGVHELAVTFVTPRRWPTIELQVSCSAHGERKMLWVRQSATLGHVEKYVQLIPAAMPVRRVVLKPTDSDSVREADRTAVLDSSAASPTKWRPPKVAPATSAVANATAPKVADKTQAAATVTKKTVIEASLDAKDAKISAIEAVAN